MRNLMGTMLTVALIFSGCGETETESTKPDAGVNKPDVGKTKLDGSKMPEAGRPDGGATACVNAGSTPKDKFCCFLEAACAADGPSKDITMTGDACRTAVGEKTVASSDVMCVKSEYDKGAAVSCDTAKACMPD